MNTINIKTYNELKEVYNSLNDNYIYRGQADSEWQINSTLYRSNFISDKKDGENRILNAFDKSIHLYEQTRKIPTDKIEKLAYLQHHGAPTRLIDFTYSPYIATYFALKDCKETCSVFSLDYTTLPKANIKHVKKQKEKYLEELLDLQNIKLSDSDKEFALKFKATDSYNKILKVTDKNLYPENVEDSKFRLFYTDSLISLIENNLISIRDEQHYSSIFSWQNTTNIIFKLDPFYQTLRRIAQSGCFLSQNNTDISFNETLNQLYLYKSEMITKINIPTSLRKEILTDLIKMNISENSMFPELDGFVRSLGLKILY